MPVSRIAVVIEDDDDVRGLIGIVLAGEGLKVVEAATAASGIEAVREHLPDLVVLDYGLPDLDGVQAASRIRELTQNPILMLTAREDIAAAVKPDVTSSMTKPFRPAQLGLLARDLLGRASG